MNPSQQENDKLQVCPHVVTSDEGTSYCNLAESGVKELQSQLAAAHERVERAEAACAEKDAALTEAGRSVGVCNVETGDYRRCPVCRGDSSEKPTVVHTDECPIGRALSSNCGSSYIRRDGPEVKELMLDKARLDFLDSRPLPTEIRGGSNDGQTGKAWGVAAYSGNLREAVDIVAAFRKEEAR